MKSITPVMTHQGEDHARNALACGECGAGLPPPDEYGTSSCVYCGAEHRERSSEVLAAAIAMRRTGEGSDSSARTPPSSSALLAIGADASRASWHDGEDAASIPMTEDAVLHLLRQHFRDAHSVYVCPHVPPKKEQAARAAHAAHLEPRERILALYDASWLGSGDEGFVVTARRLCWKNPLSRSMGYAPRAPDALYERSSARAILWQDVDADGLCVEPGRVVIDDDAILVAEDAVLDGCANAFHVLALSGHRWGAPAVSTHDLAASGEVPVARISTTPPTSYGGYPQPKELPQGEPMDRCCWHCRTPLFRATPQCAYCGAFPKKRGWPLQNARSSSLTARRGTG